MKMTDSERAAYEAGRLDAFGTAAAIARSGYIDETAWNEGSMRRVIALEIEAAAGIGERPANAPPLFPTRLPAIGAGSD